MTAPTSAWWRSFQSNHTAFNEGVSRDLRKIRDILDESKEAPLTLIPTDDDWLTELPSKRSRWRLPVTFDRLCWIVAVAGLAWLALAAMRGPGN